MNTSSNVSRNMLLLEIHHQNCYPLMAIAGINGLKFHYDIGKFFSCFIRGLTLLCE